MNRTLLLFLAAATVSAAQTTPVPKTAATAAKPAVRRPATATPSTVKLPPEVPAVKGVVKSAFTLRYEDFKIGTGAPAEPGKLYKVHYTGWLASDGKKFDSSFDHRQPVVDKDGKPENDADGKPKLGEPQPLTFPQGRGRLIPGWDQGFEGMKVGGKRRLFIPYQLAYGAMGRPPLIPAKADLIFDVELVDVTDMQQGMPSGHPMIRPNGGAPGGAPSGAPGSAPSPAPGTPSSPVGAPTPPPASPKPVDPTQPTVAPNSAAPSSAPAPSTPAPAKPSTTPDKPTNPAQPN